ncbi:hypothetical protein GCM10007989_06420 [Devosia pacifica]|uniref:TfoX N-terminal domain-containing protein n=1 Tax=Devosia pacifica TaxID=1335967 RepID=A0A918RXC3_9HYPH|nr:TfoX/Sxy family protein [Devosia pacifica]GHA14450.1 hypothetical protein GCM10007989_06420 [Devosia pacifica]
MNDLLEHMAERIRAQLPSITREQRMFGGLAFMQSGNMLVAVMKNGNLLVRVGRNGYMEALALPGAHAMTMGTRTMTGFVEVEADVVEDDDTLADWLERARRFVDTLPPD